MKAVSSAWVVLLHISPVAPASNCTSLLSSTYQSSLSSLPGGFPTAERLYRCGMCSRLQCPFG